MTGVVITMTALCVAVWYGEAMSPKEAPCKAVNYIIADSEERQYVTPAELNILVEAAVAAESAYLL